jgi:glycosyltransferase involved in cell wall biosynthesis
MKVAMLGHKRVPSREGGVEVVVEELARRMAAQGHSITIYNRRGHHVGGAEFDSMREFERFNESIEVVNVPTIDRRGMAALTASFFATMKAIMQHFDVIHYHAEGSCVMLWIQHILGIKTVVTVHGLDWQRAKWGRLAKMYIMLGERMAVRYADAVIVLSQNTQEYFRETYGRDAFFIPNGVSRPRFRPPQIIKEKMGIDTDSYLLFLGRIVPEKGIKNLIEAFKQVKTGKKLIIAGGASDTGGFVSEIKACAANDTRIRFVGFVQGKLLEELYSNAYVYVLPSDLEGMPLSLLEAMSYGNCCLVSDIPECAEVVGKYAATFRQGNVTSLRAALQQLCDDAGLVRNYKAVAGEYICGKFDWDKVVEETLEVYNAV